MGSDTCEGEEPPLHYGDALRTLDKAWFEREATAIRAEIERLRTALATAEAERDAAVERVAEMESAIAAKGGGLHAPTEDAYLAACRAIETHRARADAAVERAERAEHSLLSYRTGLSVPEEDTLEWHRAMERGMDYSRKVVSRGMTAEAHFTLRLNYALAAALRALRAAQPTGGPTDGE